MGQVIPCHVGSADNRVALSSTLRATTEKFFDNSAHHESAHDVAAARERGFKSRRPDFDCGGARVGTGGRLLSVTSQVRFLPPQLCDTEGQLA